MNWLSTFSSAHLLDRLGGTVLHSLWQFTAIGLLFWALQQMLSRWPANFRYLMNSSGVL
jgi:hypothetical protein